MMNSHDGSLAMRVINTPIRVVCANTLSMALRATGGFYAKHTRNILSRASEARNLLTLANAYYDTLGKQIDRLVHTRMTELETANYLKSVYQFKEDKKHEKQDYRMIRSYEATMNLLNHPTNTLGGIQGTQYAAFNAVTYYIDHLRPVRGGKDEDGKRLDGSWFGHGATIRQRAYDLLAVSK
jgi:phage/plasmid-like protein (TIGR03299 family)